MIRINNSFLYFLLCSIILLPFFSCSPLKYAIKVTPNGMSPGDTMYMGAYFGKSVDLFDTAVIDSKGVASFKGKNALPSGMYNISPGDYNKSFDFFISGNQPQKFEVIYGDTTSVIKNNSLAALFTRVPVKFRGSADNCQWTGEDCRKYKTDWSDDSNMLSLYFKINADEDNSSDKEYLREHYFDGIDFSDPRIARMPGLEDKLYGYFFHVLNVLDTVGIKGAVDTVLYKAVADAEVYCLSAGFLYDIYINSPFPGHDKVAKYIADNYILAGYTSAFSPEFIIRVKNETGWVSQNPVGAIAPDMKLQSISGDYIRLSDIKADAVALLFFDPDCGVCRQVVPQVYNLYKVYRDKGFEVYCIYLGYDMNEWKSYIIKNNYDWINVWSNNEPEIIYNNYSLLGMPTIYLLDGEKRIEGKDITVEELHEELIAKFR